LAPSRSTETDGIITSFKNGLGHIDGEDVWFSKDALSKGYEPVVGDTVQIHIISNMATGN